MLSVKKGDALQWRHNECDGVSKHQRLNGFAQPFVHAQIKENIKAENVSIWWRHVSSMKWMSSLSVHCSLMTLYDLVDIGQQWLK